jgi:hypothetical protein
MSKTETETVFKSGFAKENDEIFTLYETEDRLERIVLHRSIEQQQEFIILSPSLIIPCEIHNPLGGNILFMNQYHLILRHKRNIQRYLIQEDKLVLFIQILGMSTSDFFDSISLNV